VSFGVLKLSFRMDIRARVARVKAQTLIRPRRTGLAAVITWIVADKIYRQLPALNELLEKRLLGEIRYAGVCCRQRDSMDADMAEMKIRRQLASAVNVRLIALLIIGGKPSGEKPVNRS
jgi:hypothetical protein